MEPERPQLANDVEKAQKLLVGLTASRDVRHKDMPLGTEAMPRTELVHCAGLAFTFTKKGGVIVSYEQGTGFVIAKLPPSPDGLPRWSAPLFFDTYGSSVGLTAGFSVVDSVIVLDTQEAVDAYKSKSQASLAADLNVSFGSKVGVNMPATALDMIHPKVTNKTFAYSSTKGLMVVDSSLKGLGYRINDKLNAAVYGPEANSASVLESAPPPPEFEPLYATINEVMTAPEPDSAP